MADRFLTLDQATNILPVAKITLRRAIQAGELDAFKPGKVIVVKESDLLRWVDSRKVVPASKSASPSFSKTSMSHPRPGSLRDRALQQRGRR